VIPADAAARRDGLWLEGPPEPAVAEPAVQSEAGTSTGASRLEGL
jgi:hypothetical protein